MCTSFQGIRSLNTRNLKNSIASSIKKQTEQPNLLVVFRLSSRDMYLPSLSHFDYSISNLRIVYLCARIDMIRTRNNTNEFANWFPSSLLWIWFLGFRGLTKIWGNKVVADQAELTVKISFYTNQRTQSSRVETGMFYIKAKGFSFPAIIDYTLLEISFFNHPA